MDRAGQLDALIDGAEELLTNLTDAHDPDIQELRDRVDRAIRDTRRAIAENQDEMAVRLRDLVVAVDGYVRGYPWLALTTGVLVAGTIGFIAGVSATPRKS